MKKRSDITPSVPRHRAKRQKTIDLLLKVATFFIVLEPIWMLLPFAGFLYGSVMPIQLLSRNPATAWLVHFVLPTHTLFPLGLILMAVGLLVFLVGAAQIYTAKILQTGLVRTGIYRKFRHPQYLSLTLFGLGILLTWGRVITYIAFFIMMWLYYFLSKSEERKCLAAFGKDYEAYRRNTWFLFPGERKLAALGFVPLRTNLPKWAALMISFVIVMGAAVGSSHLIQTAKRQLRPKPPSIQGKVDLSEDGTRPVAIEMVKGPVMQAAPFQTTHDRFMDRAFEMLIASPKIKQALRQVDLGQDHRVTAFLNPGSNWYTDAHHNYRKAEVNAYLVVTGSVADSGNASIFENGQSAAILKLIKAEALSYGRLEDGLDPTQGLVTISGPPMGLVDSAFQERVRKRIAFLTSGL